MGSSVATWKAAFAAEGAKVGGKHLVAVLLDLVKAFEMIPHAALYEAAKEYGYNLVILRLSIASYRLLRVISRAGVYSRTILASVGITAGSGFATSELRCLLLEMIDRGYKLHHRAVDLCVHVDDVDHCRQGCH